MPEHPRTGSPCPACGTALVPHAPHWRARCGRCGLWASSLDDPALNGATPHGWDVATEAAMAPVRERAATSLCTQLVDAGLLGAGTRLLDVGCGPGWFLRAAAARGATVRGLEPDARVAAASRAGGLAVDTGCFPGDIAGGPFDLVSFNDVFEHLPAPRPALAAVRACLAADGVLLLTLPSSRGAFHRFADLLARLGIESPLERLWQKGFESPHLWYFDADNLLALTAAEGFRPVWQGSLPSVSGAGLWGRIRAGGGQSVPAAAVIWLGVALLLPLLRRLPSDIMSIAFRRA